MRTSDTSWNRRDILLLAIATAGLGSNFVLFNSSVAYLSASACQILAQAGPVLLLVGSVVVLREPFLPIQGIGVVTLLAGMLMFFSTRLGDLAGGSSMLLGLFLGLAASRGLGLLRPGPESPAALHVAHTHHARHLSLLRPRHDPAGHAVSRARRQPLPARLPAFACLNTIIAYGAFAKAMSCWHAAKVSAIVTTTPLFTMTLETLAHAALPAFWPEESFSMSSIAGAIIAVLGALGIALGPMLRLPHLPRPASRKQHPGEKPVAHKPGLPPAGRHPLRSRAAQARRHRTGLKPENRRHPARPGTAPRPPHRIRYTAAPPL